MYNKNKIMIFFIQVSCEIACEIGILMYSYDIIKRSANIIITVLLRCRHKGVVEAAGTAIAQLTRYNLI